MYVEMIIYNDRSWETSFQDRYLLLVFVVITYRLKENEDHIPKLRFSFRDFGGQKEVPIMNECG